MNDEPLREGQRSHQWLPPKYLSSFNMPIMSGRKKSRWRLPVGNSHLFWFCRSVLKKEQLVKHWTPALKVPVLSELVCDRFCLKRTQAEKGHSPEVKVEGHRQRKTFHFSHYLWQEKISNRQRKTTQHRQWECVCVRRQRRRTDSDSWRVHS